MHNVTMIMRITVMLNRALL